MDGFWNALVAVFEWIFAAAKPIGGIANGFFIAVGFIGTAYWLWYGEKTRKGGHNFMSEGPSKK